MLDTRHGFPHAPLWPYETPIEPQPRLAEAIGAREVLIKRDDCNGLAFGGNKVRQLEYYIGDALSKGADTVLMTGAVQSNFVRTAAAACNRYGLTCHIQLENRVDKDDPEYRNSGNVLLNRVLGATLHYFNEDGDEAAADRKLSVLADKLRADGAKPYIVPMHPDHDPIGALGYIDAARELIKQIESLPTMPDRIFVGSGSGNTHAGLVYGLRKYGCSIPVSGICVRRAESLQRPRIHQRCEQLAAMFEEESPLSASDIAVDDSFLVPGYGQAGPSAIEAMQICARMEGLILDPVYTAKVMAGLISHSRREPDQNLLFIHTGGSPALFAYANDIRRDVLGDPD
ncbi:MAG: D-cysteine desulfhydrase family protein [Pseudomonadota bacterium]